MLYPKKTMEYERIGIKAVQSVLQNATQSNLSMFHNAGNIRSKGTSIQNIIFPKPSITQILDLVDPKESCSMEAIIKDYIYPKDLCCIKLQDILIKYVSSKYISEDDDENCFYTFLETDIPKKYMRCYIDAKKIFYYGYTLKDISDITFPDHVCILSPDFMGIIDIVLKMSDILDLKSHHIIGKRPCLEENSIKDCIIIENKIYTIGSSLVDLLLHDNVLTHTVVSNNIQDVRNIFGIEAANQLIQELIDNKYSEIIADFMTRFGEVMAFNKKSIYDNKRGFINDISFQKPKDTIVQYLGETGSTIDNGQSIYSKIWSSVKDF